jgi:excinuclease ABC subunit C
MAPCHFKVSKKDYTDMTKKAVAFFEGDYSEILSLMRSKMERASEEMQFELAMEYRDKMTRILRVKDEQNVMLDQSKSVDIIATKQKDDHFAIAIFSIRKGALIVTMSDALDTFLSENEAMAAYLEQYYNDSDERPREVYLMHEMERTVFDHLGIRVSVPQRGDKRKMIDMVRKNANDALHKHIMKTLTKVDRSEAALSEIKTLTGLESAKTIEMFDNSNIQGSDAVSAMVSFVGGVPNKDGYRKFKVKTIVGADDVGTMREIVTRRYSRLKDEGAQMPDLVLIDGALAQVRAAKSALDEVGVSLPVFGLAKDDRHRTSHLVRPDGEEILLTGYSNAKRLLTHIQEEVHRFAITFFRKTKQKSAIVSQLDGIKGLGTKRKQLLLTHFKSVKGIAKATVSDIEAIGIPKEVANAILDKIKETP